MNWILNGDDERLPDLWPGAVDLTETALGLVLAAAREQCEAYAPTVDNPEDVPARYILAQALQAKALSTAGFAGGNDQVGGYGEGVTVYPMDWQVKNLLRPRQGRPFVL